MTHLEEITRDALWSVEHATAAIRLAAAILYKQDVNQSEVGEWFGVTRRTITKLTRSEFEEKVESAISEVRFKKLRQ